MNNLHMDTYSLDILNIEISNITSDIEKKMLELDRLIDSLPNYMDDSLCSLIKEKYELCKNHNLSVVEQLKNYNLFLASSIDNYEVRDDNIKNDIENNSNRLSINN